MTYNRGMRAGYLEVIAGPMFSGKTEELIRRLKRAAIGKKKVQVFKHSIDTRYGTEKKLFSHNGMSFGSEVVKDPKEILDRIDKNTEIVGIDEAQWFGDELIDTVNHLLKGHKKVIVSGLAMTFDRQPFAPMPTLMALADSVTKLSAICTICGDDAVFHKRLTKSKTVDSSVADPSLVGKFDAYEARCRKCYNKA
ncbi:thymidine kinase [Candidatus Gottesmanbacteria bacterium]|nr:thymidine kinase [Candidatus Gottesmanbacteria bacterium]